MPNLNLKGDAGRPGLPAKPGAPTGGGFMSKKVAGLPMVVVLLIGGLIGLGGAYFVLQKAGIIGKKRTTAVVVPPPAATVDTAAQAAVMAPETEGLVDFKEKPSSKTTQTPAKSTTTVTPGKALSTQRPSETTAANMSGSASLKIPMSAKGTYSVQVSSWSSEQKANIEADVLKRAGFPAFVEKANVAGEGRRYRVYIGRYESDKAARSTAERMAHMLEGGYWVVRLGK